MLLLLFILQLTASTSTESIPIDRADQNFKSPCSSPYHNSYPFCNTSLSVKSRAEFLVSLLTLEEKIQQLGNNASAIPRLGIPPYEWWSESLHGIASNGPGVSFDGIVRSATGFPQVIVTAASFNRSLCSSVAYAIAVEAKAMYNVGQAGLTYWAPNINIFRDPRWGRGQETPGEDPMVTSAFAVEYVRAFQGEYHAGADRRDRTKSGEQRRVLRDEDDDKLTLSACCKHFTAYDLENWGRFTRYNFNAVVSDQDMEDTFQPPFRSCIQKGNASCLMCSYNAVNGIPACTDHNLLQRVRQEWNFRGYITSDCDAVATIYENQNYTKTPEDAVASALKAGTDINCGTYMSRHMKSAIEKSKVSEKDIDRAIVNLFSVQLRLGIFDARNRVNEFGPQDVCSSEHKKLALEAALQGIVLLKNEHKLLPLRKHSISSLAVIGPMGNSTELGGGYTGVPCDPLSIFNSLREYVNDADYALGCRDVSCNSTDYFAEAISVAMKAEYVVVVAGLDLSQEREDLDRYSLLLPGYQTQLVSAIAEACKKPLILVLTGGGPIDISFALEHPRIGSILWIGYPGENGGRALSQVIFGQYNPGGRLPVTWYPESFTGVPMSDMNMRANLSRNYPGRTHRFYNGKSVYKFGYGLSYTNFIYKLLSAPEKLSLKRSIRAKSNRTTLDQKGDNVDYIYVDDVTSCKLLRFKVDLSIHNNGDMDGSEVTLLFSKGSQSFKGSPERQLIGFDRVGVLAHESAEVSFVIDPCEHLSFADEYGKRILLIGKHVIMSHYIEHIVSIEI